MSALHAKVISIDQRETLITSANLSYHGQEANIELQVDTATGEYSWKRNPFEAWESIGPKLVGIVLDEKEDNPEYLGKSRNLWSNLFKEVLLYRMNIQ